MTAWEKERDRISEANRIKQERHQRRAAMSNAIGSDIGYMPPKAQRVPGAESLPEKEEVNSLATNLAQVADIAGEAIGGIGGADYASKLRNESSIGKLLGLGTNNTPPTEYAAPDWMSSYNPEPSGTYDYTKRYNPDRYLTK
jgi:hypothetical protein